MANVNRPTDTAQKEKDINQKLQFYGIYSAFAAGKAPSNKQIDVALNSFLESRALRSPSKNLSAEGRDLVADVRVAVEETKKMLLSKNEGNLIQEFIWDAQHISGGNASTPGMPLSKDRAQQHGDEALDGLKTLGRLLLSNGQFRKLLDDAVVLIRDMAGDAAQTAANKVNPDESRLKQIDEPAEDNTWHDVPDLSRDNIKQQASQTYNQNKPFSRDEAAQAAREGADTAQQHPSSDNRESGKAGASAVADRLKAKADQNIPDETQEQAIKAKETAKTNTKNYLGKKMPQERREQTIWRLKKMVVEIQGHSDYQEAIETLLSLAETYAGHGRNLASQSAGTVQDARQDSALQRAETNLKTLVERFANFTSLDDLFDSLNELYRDADRDPELKNWFKKLDRYIRRCLQEQGFILRDEATREWDQIYDKGQFLLRDRYRDHTDHLIDELQFMADQFEKDPQNQSFGRAMEKLFLDLGQDENGAPAFKPHLIKDLTEVIIPAIFENTRYVPIPRIEVSDPMVDVVVENLVIETDNLFPNSLEFGSDNYWKYGRKNIKGTRQNKIMIAGSGIQMDLRDVAYYLNKKQGFPSIADKGVMDIILAGEGFSFKIAARNAHKSSDQTHFIAIDKVDVVISNLQIKIKKSNHKLLFTIAKSLLLKVMKPAIQKAIEKTIKDNFEKADAYAWEIYKEVQKGAEAAKQDPENAPNIFQQYVNAYQHKALEKKEKAKQKTKDTDVNIAMTKEDSMFKNISLPGGISTKATEYKQLAEKGNRWESPVFGIGSAKASADIPSTHKITRKPHQTRSAGVRGGNHPNASSTTSTVPTGMANTGVDSTTVRGPTNTMPGVGGGYGASSGAGTGYGASSGMGSGYGTSAGTGGDYGASSGAGTTHVVIGGPSGAGSTGLPTSTGTSTAFGGPATTAPGAPGSVGAASTGFGGSTGTSTVPESSSNLTGFSRQVDSAIHPHEGVDSTLRPSSGGATFYDSATRQ